MERHRVKVGATVYRKCDGRAGKVLEKITLYGSWKYTFRVMWSDRRVSLVCAPALSPVPRKKKKVSK